MSSINRYSVLVVEDDQEISKLIKHNIEDKDTQVIEAATGLECIRILRKARVDLILLDIRLPDLNGWSILDLLRWKESLRHIPVIMVSVEPPDVDLIEKLRPDDYIQKPFDIRDLLARVKKFTDSRRVPVGDSPTRWHDGGAYQKDKAQPEKLPDKTKRRS